MWFYPACAYAQSIHRGGNAANQLKWCLSIKAPITFSWSSMEREKQMHLARHLSGIASPVITGDKAYLERRKQAQQPTAGLIVAWAKGICHDSFSLGIKGIPKPMSMLFIANIGPLLIKFTDKRHVIEHHLFGGYLPWCEFFRARMTVLMPILRARAVSRTPEPLKAISTILSLTPGLRAS